MKRQFSLQEHIQIAASSGLSLCVLDNTLKCVFGNGVINTGDKLTDMLHDRVKLPIEDCCISRITVEDSFYCVRIFSVSDEYEPLYYLCEVLDSTAAGAISENTELASGSFAALESMRYCAGRAQELAQTLGSGASGSASGVAEELRLSLERLNAMLDVVSVYLDVINSHSENVLFDLGALCERLCSRCNSALSDIDRCIELPLCDEGLYVCADCRNTVIVLMNIIRNAIIFDDNDRIPQMIVCRDTLRDSIILRVINAPSALSRNDWYGRMWMELIRRYASFVGGYAELVREERCVLMLSLPAASDAEIAEYRLEECPEVLYETEIRRILEPFASGCEMTANVQ